MYVRRAKRSCSLSPLSTVWSATGLYTQSTEHHQLDVPTTSVSFLSRAVYSAVVHTGVLAVRCDSSGVQLAAGVDSAARACGMDSRRTAMPESPRSPMSAVPSPSHKTSNMLSPKLGMSTARSPSSRALQSPPRSPRANSQSQATTKPSSAVSPASTSTTATAAAPPLDTVTLRQADYQQLLSAVSGGQHQLSTLEKSAEYQLVAQKEYYVNQIKLLRTEVESLLKAKDAQVNEWKAQWKRNEGDRERVRDEYERERERLEEKMRAHAEKRLLEHTRMHEDKCRELEDERRERAKREDELATELSTTKDEYESRLAQQQATLTGRIGELTVQLAGQEKQYEEALVQLEAEYDSELLLMKSNTTQQLSKHRENTAILVAEMSAAKRKLDEKNSTLSNLELVVAEQDDNLHHTSAVIKKLTSTLTSSKLSLRLKEEDITRRQYELAGARQDNTVLKNFIEILEHRIAELENREAPALDALMSMKARIESMSNELFVLNGKCMEAKEEMARKRGESERLFTSVTSLRHKLAKREQWAEMVKKELKYLVERSANGSANDKLHVDVRKLYSQLFVAYNTDKADGSGTVQADDEAEDDVRMQNRVAAEVVRQRRYLEKSVNGMKRGIDSMTVRHKREGEKALTQNINFLYEVNRLREDNKRLEARCSTYRALITRSGLARHIQHLDDEDAALLAVATDSLSANSLPPAVKPAVATVEVVEEEEEQKEQAVVLVSQPTLVLGSTRPLYDVSHERHDVSQLRASLDSATDVIDRQRQALAHLQRGVETAIDIAQQRWYEAEALRRRIKEVQAIASPRHTARQPPAEADGEEAGVEGGSGGGLRSPFKHAKAAKSPAGGVVLPSLAGAGTLNVYGNAPQPGSLEAKLATIMHK